MAHIDRTLPGSFCWMELSTTDQSAAKAFYTSLFGWTATDQPMGPGQFYTMFFLGGCEVAAGYTMMKEEAGMPPHWNLYIAVESADAAAARVPELGGKALAGPSTSSMRAAWPLFRTPPARSSMCGSLSNTAESASRT